MVISVKVFKTWFLFWFAVIGKKEARLVLDELRNRHESHVLKVRHKYLRSLGGQSYHLMMFLAIN